MKAKVQVVDAEEDVSEDADAEDAEGAEEAEAGKGVGVMAIS